MTNGTRGCRGCGVPYEATSDGHLYCSDACRLATRSRIRSEFREIRRGRLPKGVIDHGPLSRLTETKLLREFLSLRARVEAGELPAEDARWIDVRDEVEIRVREHGAVQGWGVVLTWDHANGRLRERDRVRTRPDTPEPASPARVFRCLLGPRYGDSVWDDPREASAVSIN